MGTELWAKSAEVSISPLPSVIGLMGHAGSGKSTAAAILARDFGYVRLKFAGPLKSMMRALGLGDDEIEGSLKEQPCALLGGKSPRYAMQTIGHEWGRLCMGEEFWSGLGYESACRVLDEGGRVVFDDVRYENEARAIRRLGGQVIGLRRPGAACLGGGHASEAMAFDPDGRVLNDGPEDVLAHRLAGAIRRLGTGT